MKIIQYSTPGDYLEENQDYLLTHEVEAQLNMGNALTHRNDPCGPGLLFGKVEDRGKTVLLFGHTEPWNVCLDDVSHSSSAVQAVQELAAFLKQMGYSFPGVNGREHLCKAFLTAWGGTYQLRIAMDAMVLRHLKMPSPQKGHLRLASPQDQELLTQWIAAFNLEAAGREMPQNIAREKFFQRLEKGTLFVFETPEEQTVFMATIARTLPHGQCISGVYTDPVFRGQGYCQWAMAQLCQLLLNRGDAYVALFVDKVNPISNRAYQKIGFEIVEDQFDFSFNKGGTT